MDYKQLRSLSEAFAGVIYEKHKKGHDEKEDEGDEDYEKPINQEISHKGKSCKEVHPNEDHEEWEMSQNESVAEYFNNYFDGNLTEDTSDEDIIKAVEDLVDLCEAVCDTVGLQEVSAGVASRLHGARMKQGNSEKIKSSKKLLDKRVARELPNLKMQSKKNYTGNLARNYDAGIKTGKVKQNNPVPVDAKGRHTELTPNPLYANRPRKVLSKYDTGK